MTAALTLVRNDPAPDADQELLELDRAVDLAEEQQASAFRTATLARWEFGKRVAAEKAGKKKLPIGRMAELMTLTGKSSQEINYRIQFAEKIHTEDQFSTAVENHASWRELRATFARSKDDGESEPDAKQDSEQKDGTPGIDEGRAFQELDLVNIIGEILSPAHVSGYSESARRLLLDVVSKGKETLEESLT